MKKLTKEQKDKLISRILWMLAWVFIVGSYLWASTQDYYNIVGVK